MSEVEVSGLRIGYKREGTGPPLVLLHGGFGFDGRSWRRQMDALSDEYTMVAWDAPGCGRSSDPPPAFRLPDYADCLAGFIRALGLSRPHVLGLSFGGALALQLFDRHPAVPRTLILAGAYAGWAGSLQPDEVDRRVIRLIADMQRPPEEWIPSYLPGLLTEAAPPEMVEEVKSLMSGVRPTANQAMLQGMAEADLRDVLCRVDVPTLLIYGDQDVRSPVEVGRALHDGIPGRASSSWGASGTSAASKAPSSSTTRSVPSSRGTGTETPSAGRPGAAATGWHWHRRYVPVTGRHRSRARSPT